MVHSLHIFFFLSSIDLSLVPVYITLFLKRSYQPQNFLMTNMYNGISASLELLPEKSWHNWVVVDVHMYFQTHSNCIFSRYCLCIFRIKMFHFMFWRNEDLAQVFSKLNWGSTVAVLAAPAFNYKASASQSSFWKSSEESDLFYLPSSFSAIYFSSCSPAVRADLNEILPELFHPHLTLFKKMPHSEI